MERGLEHLIERFRKLGAANPESWAQSEVADDIGPQFARFVFLRELWKCVIPVGDRRWMRSAKVPNDDGRGGALRRIKESGVNIDDLTQVVRAAQIGTIHRVVELLDMLFDPEPSLADVRWGLFELGDDDLPKRCMDGLHETLYEEDVMGPS